MMSREITRTMIIATQRAVVTATNENRRVIEYNRFGGGRAISISNEPLMMVLSRAKAMSSPKKKPITRHPTINVRPLPIGNW